MYDKLSYKSLKHMFINNFEVNHLFLDFIAEVEQSDEELCKLFFITKLKRWMEN
jgi:hypothetical protein